MFQVSLIKQQKNTMENGNGIPVEIIDTETGKEKVVYVFANDDSNIDIEKIKKSLGIIHLRAEQEDREIRNGHARIGKVSYNFQG